MGNLMAYSGIVTKVRAMQAKLLTRQDFENIAALRSVPEIISYLKEKPAYAEFMNQMDVSLYHRRHVEKILYQSLYDDYTRIFHFAGLEQKKFLKLYLKRYEVDLINYCFRIVFNHYEKPFDLDSKKEFFDKYSQISIEKLITSRNVTELVDNLQSTEYYAPLRNLRDANDATLFDYDLTLELYYFSNIWKKRKQILRNKKELEIYTRDCGTNIDLLNLQWIYRAKKYYHMLPPDIYSLTIPNHYRLRIDEFKALVEAPTLEEFERLLEDTYYAKKYNIDDSKTLQQRYKECLMHLYLTDRRSNPYSIATITTYLFLKEEEIYKLTTALECIRYGLSSRETLGYLGGVIQ